MPLFSSATPLVSVIIAAYNHESYVLKALQSVLNQTFKNLEVIVIDDGSSDQTAEVVASINDPRLQLIRLKENRRWHPRNIGLEKARGEYVAFQNSDDVWDLAKLEKQLQVLNSQPSVVACFTAVEIINIQDSIQQESFVKNAFTIHNRSSIQWLRDFFDEGNCLCISSSIIRRKAMEKVGPFNPHLFQLSDLDLWVRLAAVGDFHILSEKLTFMRVVEGKNLSRPTPEAHRRTLVEQAEILERYAQFPIDLKLTEVFEDVLASHVRLSAEPTLVLAGVAQYALKRHTHQVLFAHKILSQIIDVPEKREKMIAEYGTGMIHAYFRSRGLIHMAIASEVEQEHKKEEVESWLHSFRKESNLRLGATTLSESKEWTFKEGMIQHISSRFFKVIGVRWKHQDQYREQPLLDQREIGTLGFILRSCRGKKELLVQAKVEPGNVGAAQLAPTAQSTESNNHQVHGGQKPPYADNFYNVENLKVWHSSLQSEQGTRFYHKRNRNVLIESLMKRDTLPHSHRWLDTETVFDLMHRDFLVNTDARSVLVCSPWEALVDRVPFTRYSDDFAKALQMSLEAIVDESKMQALKGAVYQARAHCETTQIIPLEELTGWFLNIEESDFLLNHQASFRIKQITVEVRGREVPRWDQPILESLGEGKVVLYCARVNGVLHFLFKESREPGFYNHVELSASVVVEAGRQVSRADSTEP